MENEKLRQAREAEGLSLRQLDKMTNVDRKTIRQLELGRRRARRATIVEISKGLRRTPEELGLGKWAAKRMSEFEQFTIILAVASLLLQAMSLWRDSSKKKKE